MSTDVMVRVDETGADAERLDRLSALLREELLEFDVDTVVPAPTGDAPAGSRGVDAAAIGTLVVSVEAGVELLTHLIRGVRAWLHRSTAPDRSVELTIGDATIRLTDVSTPQQDRLIDQFVHRVAAEQRS